jgi:hypothetical protein
MTWNQGAEARAESGDVDFSEIARGLEVLGYSVAHGTLTDSPVRIRAVRPEWWLHVTRSDPKGRW